MNGSRSRGVLSTTVLCLALIFDQPNVDATRFSGSIQTTDSWKFANRFCFNDHDLDEMDYELSYSVTYARHQEAWLLVYTEPSNDISKWLNLYDSGESCPYKIKQAAYRIPLHDAKEYPEGVGDDGRGSKWVKDTTVIKTTGTTWAFIAFATCLDECDGSLCSMPLELTYSLTFKRNGGEQMSSSLSADQSFTYRIYAVLFAFQSILFFFFVRIYMKLREREKQCAIVALLFIAIFLQWLGLMLLLGYYVELEDVGADAMNDLLFYWGTLLLGNAELSFILHLILIGKGLSIVRAKISNAGNVKLTIYAVAYYLFFWIATCWSAYFTDPARVTYYYSSLPGVAMMVLRLAATMWFNYACLTTRRGFKKKIHFYRKFSLYGTLWFLWRPLAAIVAYNYPSHLQNPILIWFTLFGAFGGQLTMALMFDPSDQTHSFPFHQVTALSLSGITTAASPTSSTASSLPTSSVSVTKVVAVASKKITPQQEDVKAHVGFSKFDETLSGRQHRRPPRPQGSMISSHALQQIKRSLDTTFADMSDRMERLKVTFEDLCDSDEDNEFTSSDEEGVKEEWGEVTQSRNRYEDERY